MRLSVIFLLFYGISAMGQYAPAAGKSGSTAVYKDSTAIIDWASKCSVVRGWKDIAIKDSGKVDFGLAEFAQGAANGKVVSLGDSGVATLEFDVAIANGKGADFVVFENSFSDNFLELAFVEVSSNGQLFVRFPAVSLTQDSSQVGSFGSTDPTKLYNFAGKYRGQYGVPFDLEELKGMRSLDVNNITHIRIVDVVGTIDSLHASTDSKNNKVNDPYPTAFGSGGFDLDGVGVLYNKENFTFSIDDIKSKQNLIYPTLVQSGEPVHVSNGENKRLSLKIYSSNGSTVFESEITQGKFTIPALVSGVYFISIETDAYKNEIQKIVVK